MTHDSLAHQLGKVAVVFLRLELEALGRLLQSEMVLVDESRVLGTALEGSLHQR